MKEIDMNLEDKVQEAKAENIPVLANKNLFINFWMRIYEFVIKLINPRTAVFAVATFLTLNGTISEWVWLIVATVFLGERWVKTIQGLISSVKK